MKKSKTQQWRENLAQYGFIKPVIRINGEPEKFSVFFTCDGIDLEMFIFILCMAREVYRDEYLLDEVEFKAVESLLEAKIGNTPVIDFVKASIAPAINIDSTVSLSDQIVFEGLWVEDPEASPYPEITELFLLLWHVMETFRSKLCLEMTMDIREEYENMPIGKLPEVFYQQEEST